MQSRETVKVHRAADLPLLDRVALALLFVLVLSNVLGGATRYFAVQLHLPWIPYVPHVLAGLAVAPMFFAYLVDEGITTTYLFVFVLFGIGTTYGIFNLGSASQVEFGLWVFVDFLFGIVALPAVIRGWRRLTPYVFFLWVVAVVGVVANLFHAWPWVGLQYQVGATSISASRSWSTAGFWRLPGFSRASFDAALQILVMCLFLSGSLRKKWWVPVWILSGFAIALTTTKTALGIFLVFSIGRAFRRNPLPRFWRYVPLASVALDIVVPFSMLFIRIDWLDSASSHLWVPLVASFVGRMQEGWPACLRTVLDRGTWLFGRGLGGIGVAQQYFEPALYSPGDNIAVYLFGTFGVLGIILLCVYASKSARARIDGPIGRFFLLCVCLVLLEGLTVNVLEGALTGLVFGASLRYFVENPARSRLRATVGQRVTTRPIGQRGPQPESAA